MEALGSMLAVLHAWVATGAAILAGGVLLLALLDAAGVARTRRWQDRVSAALVVALLGALLLGPGVVVGVGPPSDATHYLYAVAALAAVPAGRLLAPRGSTRAGWWVAGGALVTLLALLRLWATGS